PQQWALHNTGQVVRGQPGLPDADLNAPEAWDVTRGSGNVVVAVIDTGVDVNHPDVRGALWVNQAEASGRPGVDDDRNGYVDDVHGYDFINQDGTVFDPEDGDEHGTLVAGIIAARWGNGQGVAGLAPGVRLMVLKFLAEGVGTTADAIKAIAYAERMGARIANLSWGNPGYDPALYDALRGSSLLFVAAAGNDGSNNDVAPFYPASYRLPNLMSVAAADNRGQLAGFSNYGPHTVDLAAPGQDILSTMPPLIDSGAALQVDAGTYRAVVLGFDLQQVADPGARRFLMEKVLDFFGLDRRDRILLVDDDGSRAPGTARAPDVAPFYGAALWSLGQAYERVEVPGPGPALLPDLDPKRYPAVIWFTGHSPGSFETPNLTWNDQYNLALYLLRGGQLLLAGPDALRHVESSTFVRKYLHTRVAGAETERIDLRGTRGSIFGEAVSYRLTPALGTDAIHDRLEPAGPGARKALVYPAQPGRLYAFKNGTSLAAPHVTGVAALVASRFPTMTAPDIRARILATGKPVPGLAGRVAKPVFPDAAAAVGKTGEEPPGGEPPGPQPPEGQPPSGPGPEPETPAFPDVPSSMALAGEIRRAAALGLVQGFPDGRFRPHERVTRHQFAKMMVAAYERALGVSLPADPAVDFPDVDEGDGDLGSSVAKAASAGWITGYPDGTFRPTQPINRLQAAVIVARALRLPPEPGQPFADVRGRFAGEVGAVARAGIMKGMPAPGAPGTLLFKPDASLTRAEAAAVAVRAYDHLRQRAGLRRPGSAASR
ncbi:MAG TPA: S8 family serine peptidase, partial [Thermaerobacter sp.]